MHIAFENLTELEEFLQFAGYQKSDTKVAGLLTAVPEAANAPNTGSNEPETGGSAPLPETANTPNTGGNEPAPAADKPKRRTKAQIAADEAAAVAAQLAEAAEPSTATETVKDAIPPAEGDAPPSDAPPSDEAAKAWILPRAQELLMTGTASDQAAHLTAARNMIGAVGHALYPESFRLIGAPVNSSIINFNDEQRAHHLASMEWMTNNLAAYKQ